MFTSNEPFTHAPARLSFADERDIDEFVAALAKFEAGEMTPAEWRTFRLVRGTYAQRQADDAQMLRVKVPQGVLEGAQLRALADVAERWSRGFCHITTRQNFQFHFVKLHDVEPAMRYLAAAGLTTREACGNSVRNVTACPYAGVAADEVFDVTPYAEAMTRHLLRHPLGSGLPRKFKIAFEGCPDDHVRTAINDLGFRAAIQSGVRGFRVTVAGGTSILCRTAAPLHEFLPAADLLRVAEAVLGVFSQFGDYEHKQRNRLKFLLKTIGWERFVGEYRKAFDEASAALPFDPEAPPEPIAPPRGSRPLTIPVIGPNERSWRTTNVMPQRQAGFAVATVTLSLGDITARQLRVVAQLADVYADGLVRVTPEQNVVFRWVRQHALGHLYRALVGAALALDGAGTLADVTSCPGAETCRIAVTQSRGLGRLLEDHFRAQPDKVERGDIKISGCPNGCGQHHVAAIGFQGSVRKVGGRAVPQYFVMAGGGASGSRAEFGRLVAKIPARRCTEAVDRLVAFYRAERLGSESLGEFLERTETDVLSAMLRDLQDVSDLQPLDYVDPGEAHAFQPETQEGECIA